MTRKLRHLIPALIMALILPPLTANSQETTEPNKPSIEWKILQEESPIEGQPDIHNHFEFSLQIDDQKESIFLAKAYLNPNSSFYKGRGFDEKSFQLTELATGKLLHAQWKTLRQGTGGYIHNSDLLIANKNSQWHVVFRNTYHGYTKTYGGEYRDRTMQFRYELNTEMLTISYTYGKSHFAYTQANKQGDTVDLNKKEGLYRYKLITQGNAASYEVEAHTGQYSYIQSYKLISEWPCILRDGSLYWGEGTKSIDVDHLDSNVLEIANFIHKDGDLSTEDMVQKLKDLNPSVKDDGSCSGIIVLRKGLAPYEQNHGHSYGGSDSSY